MGMKDEKSALALFFWGGGALLLSFDSRKKVLLLSPSNAVKLVLFCFGVSFWFSSQMQKKVVLLLKHWIWLIK
jgi:hypothetical protein